MTKGKRIGYIRVSTVDQNVDRQLHGIELDKKFTDYATGKNRERPELEALIEYAREDDVVYVHSMDRLARNVKDLRTLVDSFVNRGVAVVFIKENLEFNAFSNPISMLLLSVMGAIAEFEAARIHERMMEGIELAKKRGVYAGRKKKLNSEQVRWLEEQLKLRIPKKELAEKLLISRAALYKYEQKIKKGIAYV